MPAGTDFIISILRCEPDVEISASIVSTRPNAVGFIETIISANIPTMSGAELITLYCVTTLLSILLSDVVPIFAIAAIGFLLERRFGGSVKVLSSISFNALSPCLVFSQLVGSSMSAADAGRMAAFCLLLTSIMGFAARLVAGSLQLGGKTRTSFLLTVMFSNSGNFALPVILFAFGREGLAHASIYFVTSAVIVYTAGVFIAVHGGHGFQKAVSGIVRVPSLYALAAAFIFLMTRTEIPTAIMRPIGMLSDAAIPMMLLVLGMQLQRATFPERPAAVLIAVALSLLVAPVIGLTLSTLLGMTGVARSVAIVVSAMPAAVVTTVLALEFNLDSAFVTSVVFVSTLLSPITLVLLIAYLKG
jgi:predicted permease